MKATDKNDLIPSHGRENNENAKLQRRPSDEWNDRQKRLNTELRKGKERKHKIANTTERGMKTTDKNEPRATSHAEPRSFGVPEPRATILSDSRRLRSLGATSHEWVAHHFLPSPQPKPHGEIAVSVFFFPDFGLCRRTAFAVNSNSKTCLTSRCTTMWAGTISTMWPINGKMLINALTTTALPSCYRQLPKAPSQTRSTQTHMFTTRYNIGDSRSAVNPRCLPSLPYDVVSGQGLCWARGDVARHVGGIG